MNTLRRILTGAALMLAATSFASADSIVYGSYDSGSTSGGPTTFNYGYDGQPTVALTINQFHCALLDCTLTGIEFDLSTSVVSNYSVTNQSGSTASFSVTTAAIIDVVDSATNDIYYTEEQPTNSFTIHNLGNGDTSSGSGTATSSGSVVYSASSWNITSSTGVNAGSLTQPLNPTPFIGSGTLTLDVLGDFTGSIGGTGFAGSIGGTGTETLDVIYDYSYDNPNGVPEPATMALMGGALVGLGLLRKRLSSN